MSLSLIHICLDEGKLYYLRSRGLSESQARRLMVDARFAPATIGRAHV